MRSPSTPRPADAPSEASPGRRRLGRGRSGVVYEEQAEDGRRWACKVFVPDRASSLVMAVLTGAVNPYRWSRDAVECAVLRRRLLEPLVDLWFAGRVRLPTTRAACWNREALAFELSAERIEGRHAMLPHPACGEAHGERRELVQQVLVPLQRHLAASGFDGLLWQAGKGNPVAAANFLRETSEGHQARWAWIDAESGVPALFPFNPWHLLRTYLPLTLKHGRWLFDDVDVARLCAYLDAHAGQVTERLGPQALAHMKRDAASLAEAQGRWKALGRHGRSVTSHHAMGRIDDAQAAYYAQRPARWLLRLAGRGATLALRRAGRLCVHGLTRLRPRAALAAVGRWGKFFVSQQVRERWASRFVRRRVLDWRERGFLTRDDARDVRESLRTSDAAAYVADFGVHLAMKPGLKLVTWGLVPALQVFGAIDSWWLVGFILVYGGAIGRTLYTGARAAQALLRGRPLPWVALAVGLLPVVGNTAYPLQLLAASSQKDGHVAKFMVHDIFSGLGRRLPVWGGKDTLMEHRANAVATFFARG